MQNFVTVLLLGLATILGAMMVGPNVYPPGNGASPFAVMVIVVPLAALVAAKRSFPKLGLFIYGALASGFYEAIFLEDSGNTLMIREASVTSVVALRIGLILGPIAMGFLCYEIGRRLAKRNTSSPINQRKAD